MSDDCKGVLVQLKRGNSVLYRETEKSPFKRFVKNIAKKIIDKLPGDVTRTIAEAVGVQLRKLYKVVLGGAIKLLADRFAGADFIYDRKVQDLIETAVEVAVTASIGALEDLLHSRLG